MEVLSGEGGCAGTVENLKLPEAVDVIVSEWMGVFLVKESMFDRFDAYYYIYYIEEFLLFMIDW